MNGKIIQSDNGTSWSSVDNTTNTRTLNSIAYGNNKYVAVGSRTIISSSDNGSSFGVTSTTLSFNDISYGNGLFVAVGNNEIIYTSTDGDTWTKVHP